MFIKLYRNKNRSFAYKALIWVTAGVFLSTNVSYGYPAKPKSAYENIQMMPYGGGMIALDNPRILYAMVWPLATHIAEQLLKNPDSVITRNDLTRAAESFASYAANKAQWDQIINGFETKDFLPLNLSVADSDDEVPVVVIPMQYREHHFVDLVVGRISSIAKYPWRSAINTHSIFSLVSSGKESASTLPPSDEILEAGEGQNLFFQILPVGTYKKIKPLRKPAPEAAQQKVDTAASGVEAAEILEERKAKIKTALPNDLENKDDHALFIAKTFGKKWKKGLQLLGHYALKEEFRDFIRIAHEHNLPISHITALVRSYYSPDNSSQTIDQYPSDFLLYFVQLNSDRLKDNKKLIFPSNVNLVHEAWKWFSKGSKEKGSPDEPVLMDVAINDISELNQILDDGDESKLDSPAIYHESAGDQVFGQNINKQTFKGLVRKPLQIKQLEFKPGIKEEADDTELFSIWLRDETLLSQIKALDSNIPSGPLLLGFVRYVVDGDMVWVDNFQTGIRLNGEITEQASVKKQLGSLETMLLDACLKYFQTRGFRAARFASGDVLMDIHDEMHPLTVERITNITSSRGSNLIYADETPAESFPKSWYFEHTLRVSSGAEEEPVQSPYLQDIGPGGSALVSNQDWRYRRFSKAAIAKLQELSGATPDKSFSYIEIRDILWNTPELLFAFDNMRAERYHIYEIARLAGIPLEPAVTDFTQSAERLFHEALNGNSHKTPDFYAKLKNTSPRIVALVIKWVANAVENTNNPDLKIRSKRFLNYFIETVFSYDEAGKVLEAYRDMVINRIDQLIKERGFKKEEIVVSALGTGADDIGFFVASSLFQKGMHEIRVHPIVWTRAMVFGLGVLRGKHNALHFTEEAFERAENYFKAKGLIADNVKYVILLDTGERGTLHEVSMPIFQKNGIGSDCLVINHGRYGVHDAHFAHGLNDEPVNDSLLSSLPWFEIILNVAFDHSPSTPSYTIGENDAALATILYTSLERSWFFIQTHRYFLKLALDLAEMPHSPDGSITSSGMEIPEKEFQKFFGENIKSVFDFLGIAGADDFEIVSYTNKNIPGRGSRRIYRHQVQIRQSGQTNIYYFYTKQYRVIDENSDRDFLFTQASLEEEFASRAFKDKSNLKIQILNPSARYPMLIFSEAPGNSLEDIEQDKKIAEFNRPEVWEAIAYEVGRIHGLGIYHNDLAKNGRLKKSHFIILQSEKGFEVTIIDFENSLVNRFDVTAKKITTLQREEVDDVIATLRDYFGKKNVEMFEKIFRAAYQRGFDGSVQTLSSGAENYLGIKGLPKKLFNRLAKSDQPLTVNDVYEINAHIVDEDDDPRRDGTIRPDIRENLESFLLWVNASAKDRNNPVRFGFSERWVSWFDQSNIDLKNPAVHAALVHWFFYLNGPVIDGHHRTGWILMNILLARSGIKPISYNPGSRENNDIYYQLIDNARDPLGFIGFIAELIKRDQAPSSGMESYVTFDEAVTAAHRYLETLKTRLDNSPSTYLGPQQSPLEIIINTQKIKEANDKTFFMPVYVRPANEETVKSSHPFLSPVVDTITDEVSPYRDKAFGIATAHGTVRLLPNGRFRPVIMFRAIQSGPGFQQIETARLRTEYGWARPAVEHFVRSFLPDERKAVDILASTMKTVRAIGLYEGWQMSNGLRQENHHYPFRSAWDKNEMDVFAVIGEGFAKTEVWTFNEEKFFASGVEDITDAGAAELLRAMDLSNMLRDTPRDDADYQPLIDLLRTETVRRGINIKELIDNYARRNWGTDPYQSGIDILMNQLIHGHFQRIEDVMRLDEMTRREHLTLLDNIAPKAIKLRGEVKRHNWPSFPNNENLMKFAGLVLELENLQRVRDINFVNEHIDTVLSYYSSYDPASPAPTPEIPDHPSISSGTEATPANLVGGKQNLAYINRLAQVTVPLEPRTHQLGLGLGFGADVSSAMLIMNPLDENGNVLVPESDDEENTFLIIDEKSYYPSEKTEGYSDGHIEDALNRYVLDKSIGGFTSSPTFDRLGGIRPFLLKEIEILLDGDMSSLSEDTIEIDGLGTVYSLTFLFRGKRQRILFKENTNATDLDAFVPFIEQSGGLDYYIQKASEFSRTPASGRPFTFQGRDMVEKLDGYIRQGSHVIVDWPSSSPNMKKSQYLKIEDERLRSLEHAGATFGYPQIRIPGLFRTRLVNHPGAFIFRKLDMMPQKQAVSSGMEDQEAAHPLKYAESMPLFRDMELWFAKSGKFSLSRKKGSPHIQAQLYLLQGAPNLNDHIFSKIEILAEGDPDLINKLSAKGTLPSLGFLIIEFHRYKGRIFAAVHVVQPSRNYRKLPVDTRNRLDMWPEKALENFFEWADLNKLPVVFVSPEGLVHSRPHFDERNKSIFTDLLSGQISSYDPAKLAENTVGPLTVKEALKQKMSEITRHYIRSRKGYDDPNKWLPVWLTIRHGTQVNWYPKERPIEWFLRKPQKASIIAPLLADAAILSQPDRDEKLSSGAETPEAWRWTFYDEFAIELLHTLLLDDPDTYDYVEEKWEGSINVLGYHLLDRQALYDTFARASRFTGNYSEAINIGGYQIVGDVNEWFAEIKKSGLSGGESFMVRSTTRNVYQHIIKTPSNQRKDKGLLLVLAPKKEDLADYPYAHIYVLDTGTAPDIEHFGSMPVEDVMTKGYTAGTGYQHSDLAGIRKNPERYSPNYIYASGGKVWDGALGRMADEESLPDNLPAKGTLFVMRVKIDEPFSSGIEANELRQKMAKELLAYKQLVKNIKTPVHPQKPIGFADGFLQSIDLLVTEDIPLYENMTLETRNIAHVKEMRGTRISVDDAHPINIASAEHDYCNACLAVGYNPATGKTELIEWHAYIPMAGDKKRWPLESIDIHQKLPEQLMDLRNIKIILSPNTRTEYPDVEDLRRDWNKVLSALSPDASGSQGIEAIAVFPREEGVRLATLFNEQGAVLIPYKHNPHNEGFENTPDVSEADLIANENKMIVLDWENLQTEIRPLITVQQISSGAESDRDKRLAAYHNQLEDERQKIRKNIRLLIASIFDTLPADFSETDLIEAFGNQTSGPVFNNQRPVDVIYGLIENLRQTRLTIALVDNDSNAYDSLRGVWDTPDCGLCYEIVDLFYEAAALSPNITPLPRGTVSGDYLPIELRSPEEDMHRYFRFKNSNGELFVVDLSLGQYYNGPSGTSQLKVMHAPENVLRQTSGKGVAVIGRFNEKEPSITDPSLDDYGRTVRLRTLYLAQGTYDDYSNASNQASIANARDFFLKQSAIRKQFADEADPSGDVSSSGAEDKFDPVSLTAEDLENLQWLRRHLHDQHNRLLDPFALRQIKGLFPKKEMYSRVLNLLDLPGFSIALSHLPESNQLAFTAMFADNSFDEVRVQKLDVDIGTKTKLYVSNLLDAEGIEKGVSPQISLGITYLPKRPSRGKRLFVSSRPIAVDEAAVHSTFPAFLAVVIMLANPNLWNDKNVRYRRVIFEKDFLANFAAEIAATKPIDSNLCCDIYAFPGREDDLVVKLPKTTFGVAKALWQAGDYANIANAYKIRNRAHQSYRVAQRSGGRVFAPFHLYEIPGNSRYPFVVIQRRPERTLGMALRKIVAAGTALDAQQLSDIRQIFDDQLALRTLSVNQGFLKLDDNFTIDSGLVPADQGYLQRIFEPGILTTHLPSLEMFRNVNQWSVVKDLAGIHPDLPALYRAAIQKHFGSMTVNEFTQEWNNLGYVPIVFSEADQALDERYLSSGMEEKDKSTPEKILIEDMEKAAIIGARTLLAADLLYKSRPPSDAGPIRSPPILFQNEHLGAMYPPMSEAIKKEMGILEIDKEIFIRLGEAIEESGLYYDPKEKPNKRNISLILAKALGIPVAQLADYFKQSRFILIKYKLPSGIDPTIDPENDNPSFPIHLWRALLAFHTALGSDILMIDYARDGVSVAMSKAFTAYYDDYFPKKSNVILASVFLNPEETFDPKAPFDMALHSNAPQAPSLFLFRPNEYGNSPFDPNSKSVLSTEPANYGNNQRFLAKLADMVLAHYRQMKSVSSGVETYNAQPLTVTEAEPYVDNIVDWAKTESEFDLGEQTGYAGLKGSFHASVRNIKNKVSSVRFHIYAYGNKKIEHMLEPVSSIPATFGRIVVDFLKREDGRNFMAVHVVQPDGDERTGYRSLPPDVRRTLDRWRHYALQKLYAWADSQNLPVAFVSPAGVVYYRQSKDKRTPEEKSQGPLTVSMVRDMVNITRDGKRTPRMIEILTNYTAPNQHFKGQEWQELNLIIPYNLELSWYPDDEPLPWFWREPQQEVSSGMEDNSSRRNVIPIITVPVKRGFLKNAYEKKSEIFEALLTQWSQLATSGEDGRIVYKILGLYNILASNAIEHYLNRYDNIENPQANVTISFVQKNDSSSEESFFEIRYRDDNPHPWELPMAEVHEWMATRKVNVGGGGLAGAYENALSLNGTLIIEGLDTDNARKRLVHRQIDEAPETLDPVHTTGTEIIVRLPLTTQTDAAASGAETLSFDAGVKLIVKHMALHNPGGFTSEKFLRYVEEDYNNRGIFSAPKINIEDYLSAFVEKGILWKSQDGDESRYFVSDFNLLKKTFLDLLTFKRYTDLPDKEKNERLYLLLAEMYEEFGYSLPLTSEDKREYFDAPRQRADIFIDSYIGYIGDEPIAVYDIDFSYPDQTVWGAGIFVTRAFQGRGVSKKLNDAMFQLLIDDPGIRRFHIGDARRKGSGEIKDTHAAQSLQQHNIKQYASLVDHVVTRSNDSIATTIYDLTRTTTITNNQESYFLTSSGKESDDFIGEWLKTLEITTKDEIELIHMQRLLSLARFSEFRQFLQDNHDIAVRLSADLLYASESVGAISPALLATLVLFEKVGPDGFTGASLDGMLYRIIKTTGIITRGQDIDIVKHNERWFPVPEGALPADIQKLLSKNYAAPHAIKLERSLTNIVDTITALSDDLNDEQKILITIDIDNIKWDEAHKLFEQIMHSMLTAHGLAEKVILAPKTERSRNFRNVFRRVKKDHNIGKAIVIAGSAESVQIGTDIEDLLPGVDYIVAGANFEIMKQFDIPWMPGVLTVLEAAMQYMVDKNVRFDIALPFVDNIRITFSGNVMIVELSPEIKTEGAVQIHKAEKLQLIAA